MRARFNIRGEGCRPMWYLRTMVKSIAGRLCAALLCFVPLYVTVARGQVSLPTASATPQRAALPLLYRQFLAYQSHLDRVGAALEKQGKNGSDFKDHFQQKLGFSDAE